MTKEDKHIARIGMLDSKEIGIEIDKFARVLIRCSIGDCANRAEILEGTVKVIWPNAVMKPPVINNEAFYERELRLTRVFIGKDGEVSAGVGEHLLLEMDERATIIDKKQPPANVSEIVRNFIYLPKPSS